VHSGQSHREISCNSWSKSYLSYIRHTFVKIAVAMCSACGALSISTIESGFSCYAGIAFAVEPVCLLAKLNLHYQTQMHYRTPLEWEESGGTMRTPVISEIIDLQRVRTDSDENHPQDPPALTSHAHPPSRFLPVLWFVLTVVAVSSSQVELSPHCSSLPREGFQDRKQVLSCTDHRRTLH
jgi:hypothetical protein